MTALAATSESQASQTAAALAVRGGDAPTSKSPDASSSAAATGLAVTVTLSANAQRLQAAAANLASDEAGQSSGGLAAQWNKDLADSVGSTTEFSADAEIAALPESDPDHRLQAKAAQEYVKARVTSGGDPKKYGANLFAGMSQKALAAIINDKAGLYTRYEKSAALYESTEQTNAWVMRYANDPQGQGAAFYQEAIRQFGLLSPLQQSVYPSDYVQILKIEKSRDLAGGEGLIPNGGPIGQARTPRKSHDGRVQHRRNGEARSNIADAERVIRDSPVVG